MSYAHEPTTGAKSWANRTRLVIGTALAGTFLANGVDAQESGNGEREGSWAGEIVVLGKRDGYVVQEGSSATRTSTPLLQVPQSIQVINSSLIRDQDRRSLADALVNVSGVVASKPEEAHTSQSLIRGFRSEIFLDGLPAYATNALVDPTSLVGVDRIEVVKGPTSTVYGGGAGAPLGGLINIVSVRPAERAEAYVAFRTGRWSTINPYADVNVPITDGIALRVTGELQTADSWTDYFHTERLSIQPSIAFGLGSPTRLTIMGKYDRREALEFTGLPQDAALAGTIRRDAFPGATSGQPKTTISNKLLTAELQHRFSKDVGLTVTARYYENIANRYGTFTYVDFGAEGRPADIEPTSYPIFKLYQPQSGNEFTADANLLVNTNMIGGEHNILVGANYDRTNSLNKLNFVSTSIGRIDLADPKYNLSYGAIPTDGNFADDKFNTVAVYVQDQATSGPLHLSGSLRYTSTKIKRVRNTGVLNFKETYNRLIPRVGATLDFAKGVALFAGYATGFRGAVTFNALPGQEIKPETSESYEAGVKFALNDAHLWGSVAVYQLERRNVAVAVAGQPGVSVQTGKQRARGFEVDVTWEPLRSLSLLANYAYTDAIVSQDTTIAVGSDLPRVPKHSGRVATHYRFRSGAAKGLSLGAGVTGRTSRENFLPNRGRVPGYATVDAQASYNFDPFTLTASFANILDERAFDTFQYLAPVVNPTQPRSAYIILRMNL